MNHHNVHSMEDARDRSHEAAAYRKRVADDERFKVNMHGTWLAFTRRECLVLLMYNSGNMGDVCPTVGPARDHEFIPDDVG